MNPDLDGAYWAEYWPRLFWAEYWPTEVVDWDERLTHISVVDGTVVSIRYSPEIIHEYHNLT